MMSLAIACDPNESSEAPLLERSGHYLGPACDEARECANARCRGQLDISYPTCIGQCNQMCDNVPGGGGPGVNPDGDAPFCYQECIKVRCRGLTPPSAFQTCADQCEQIVNC